MEQALLHAERQTEQEKLEAENKIISELQLKLTQLDTATQKEKDKVGAKLWDQLAESHCMCSVGLCLCPCFLSAVYKYSVITDSLDLYCLFTSRLPRDADTFFYL